MPPNNQVDAPGGWETRTQIYGLVRALGQAPCPEAIAGSLASAVIRAALSSGPLSHPGRSVIRRLTLVLKFGALLAELRLAKLRRFPVVILIESPVNAIELRLD